MATPKKPVKRKSPNRPVSKVRKKIVALTKLRETKPTGTGRMLAAKAARRIELEFQCFEMRTAGHAIRVIAQTLECDEGTVRNCLESLMTRAATQTNENVEEARQLQMERLDLMLVKYMKLAQGYSEEVDVMDPLSKQMVRKMVTHAPNQGAASLVLAIEARRSKLCALDLPEVKKLEVTGVREYVGVDVNKV